MIAAINAKLAMHHVDDAIRQLVKLAEIVSPSSFDVDQRIPFAKRICKAFTDYTEIDLQDYLRSDQKLYANCRP